MLLVENYLDESPIHGRGLFAGRDIEPGEVVWTLVPDFDRVYSPAEFEALPEIARNFVEAYAFWENGLIILTGDHDKFTNHAEDPNTFVAENGDIIAKRTIKAGEEITADYKEFDEKWHKKFEKP